MRYLAYCGAASVASYFIGVFAAKWPDLAIMIVSVCVALAAVLGAATKD